VVPEVAKLFSGVDRREVIRGQAGGARAPPPNLHPPHAPMPPSPTEPPSHRPSCRPPDVRRPWSCRKTPNKLPKRPWFRPRRRDVSASSPTRFQYHPGSVNHSAPPEAPVIDLRAQDGRSDMLNPTEGATGLKPGAGYRPQCLTGFRRARNNPFALSQSGFFLFALEVRSLHLLDSGPSLSTAHIVWTDSLPPPRQRGPVGNSLGCVT